MGGVPIKRVRIGVQLAQYAMSWAKLLAAARDAEAVAIDVLFNWDHFFGPGPDSQEAHFECWTALAAWAASTSSIELGPLVSAIGYRNPVHSIAWCAIAAGSRPANSQPTMAANAGMPRRMKRRSATGMFPSAAIPPFSELLRSQPIMAM